MKHLHLIIIVLLVACGSSASSEQLECNNQAECAADEFCSFPDFSCGSDQLGSCQKRPEVCTQIYAPVCGCDQKTYSNQCEANGAGVSISSNTECVKN